MTQQRCAKGAGCYGEHDGRGTWTQPPLCDRCLEVLSGEVWALVYDYADLEQMLAVAGGRRAAMVTESREPPVPYNVHADALQHDIWHALVTWEVILREWVNAPLQPHSERVRHGYAVQRAAAFIRPRIATLSRLPPTPGDELTGLDAIETLTALHRRAKAMLGLTKRVEIMPGQCRGCKGNSLRRESGSETVYCSACEMTETWDDYQRRLGMHDE
jgi:hypothetical protein